MKAKIALPALLSALLFGGSFFAHAKKVTTDLYFSQDRIIVSPKAGLPEKALANMLGEHGGKARKIGQSDLYIVDVPHGSPRSIIARLKHNPHFKFAELDYLVPSGLYPNDPSYLSAWHLPKIRATNAWDAAQGAGVTIAILDSGVEAIHPDLSASLVPGWNFYSNNSDTADVYGHGTKVAGAAAAITNNSIGISGVAGQAKIMPIRVSDTSGMGSWSAISSGLVYAADHGAKVANISFAAAGSTAVFSAAQYMKNKGGLVTVSAGNYGIDHGYMPSDSIIVVSATDQNDNKASWSSYGSYVDIAAPGAGILTTTSGLGYAGVSGTSFSAPVTAGVIALMMSANPKLSNLDVEKLLCSTALDIGVAGKDIYYGCGRVNAEAAVLAATVATPFVDIQSPTVEITLPKNDAVVSGLVSVSVSASDNVGVARVDLKVNNSIVAVDSTPPFGFAWDSKGTPDGAAIITAYAYDEVGNSASSNPVKVAVANGTIVYPKDTTPPTIKIVNPVSGAVSGKITITSNASDDNSASGITQRIYIDDVLKATGIGGTLSYSWNTKSSGRGNHTVSVTATDKAGNQSVASVTVNVAK